MRARAAELGVWSAGRPAVVWRSAWRPWVCGAARRRAVRLGVAVGGWGHGGPGRWCSAGRASGRARLVAARCGGGRPPMGRARRVGSVLLRSAAPVARAPRMRGAGRVARNRGGERAEPGAAPDTAICRRCGAHCILAVQVSCMFGYHRVHEGACGRAGRVVRGASGGGVALRVAPVGVWRGSPPRGAVGRGRRRVGTRRSGSVVLRGARVRAGAARRREVRWWPASDGPRTARRVGAAPLGRTGGPGSADARRWTCRSEPRRRASRTRRCT
ncbi:hypothetical protein GobsT_44060 [Gemmata obscuriglobus]|nr:hypothetical protein GobsT_44060 [Gemmata obscuriglobus]VTS08897.1 unnamed protein product [Gemmata obscuriglobus UQM 2246]